MNEHCDISVKGSRAFPKRKVEVVTFAGIGAAVACFAVVSFLPAPGRPLLEDPLRSILIGLGVVGVAVPACTIGFILKKRSANSPYFEEGFIATVINVFGILCLGVGLVCIGLGIYAFAKGMLASG